MTPVYFAFSSYLPFHSKVLARSEDDADDELLSCAVVKGGKKVVCGTQSGVMALYSWGYFNDCSDRCGSEYRYCCTAQKEAQGWRGGVGC